MPRALESIRGLADELVVVDTGSTDSTVYIARRHGAVVHHLEWADDFAAARNESLRHATKDWILVFDADQELAVESRDELRMLIQSEAFRGYMLRQLSYVGDGGDAIEHLDTRLFPNDPSLRYVGPVHEQLTCTDPQRDFEVLPCDVVVHHHGTRSYDRRKAERDSRILEHVLDEDPSNAFAAVNLGTAYLVLENYQQAELAYLRAITLAAPTNGHAPVQSYLLTAYAGLARAQLVGRRYTEARVSARRALELAPDFIDARLALAEAELRLGRPGEALTEYLRLARTAASTPWAPTERTRWKAEVGAAEALAYLGDLEAAARALDRAESAAPRHEAVARAREWLASRGAK